MITLLMSLAEEELIFYGFFFLMFLVIPAFIIGSVVWWYWIVPASARELTKAKRQKKGPVNAVFFDSGVCKLVATKQTIPEVIQNPDKTPGFLPSKAEVMVPLMPIAIDVEHNQPVFDLEGVAALQKKGVATRPLDEKEKADWKEYIERNLAIQQSLNETATKRFMLPDVGVPMVLQYAPAGFAMNAATLKMIQEGKTLMKDEAGKEGWRMLNPLNIKSYLTKMWLSIRLVAWGEYNQTLGRRQAKSLTSEKWYQAGFLLIIVIGGIIAMIVAAAKL